MGLHLFKGFLSASLFILNTLFWCVFIYVFLIFKILLPFQKAQTFFTELMARIGEMWIAGNDLNISLTQKIKWHIELPAGLSMDKSYLVCANHQSWVDIVVLQHVFNRKIPFLRFFLKQELLYVPVLGGAWWALDYPFMKRYTKEHLEKHPEKRGQDLATTIKATEKFRHSKISILNFLEGTRFRPEKHKKQQSPYRHLLLPKAGGFAFVLEAMNGKFNSILDVTIVYPRGSVSLWEAFSGKLQEVVVLVREISVPPNLLQGSYLNDADFREKFQTWIRDLWTEKDRQISEALTRFR